MQIIRSANNRLRVMAFSASTLAQMVEVNERTLLLKSWLGEDLYWASLQSSRVNSYSWLWDLCTWSTTIHVRRCWNPWINVVKIFLNGCRRWSVTKHIICIALWFSNFWKQDSLSLLGMRYFLESLSARTDWREHRLLVCSALQHRKLWYIFAC